MNTAGITELKKYLEELKNSGQQIKLSIKPELYLKNISRHSPANIVTVESNGGAKADFHKMYLEAYTELSEKYDSRVQGVFPIANNALFLAYLTDPWYTKATRELLGVYSSKELALATEEQIDKEMMSISNIVVEEIQLNTYLGWNTIKIN